MLHCQSSRCNGRSIDGPGCCKHNIVRVVTKHVASMPILLTNDARDEVVQFSISTSQYICAPRR